MVKWLIEFKVIELYISNVHQHETFNTNVFLTFQSNTPGPHSSPVESGSTTITSPLQT